MKLLSIISGVLFTAGQIVQLKSQGCYVVDEILKESIYKDVRTELIHEYFKIYTFQPTSIPCDAQPREVTISLSSKANNIDMLCARQMELSVFAVDGGIKATFDSQCDAPDPDRVVGRPDRHPYWPNVSVYPLIASLPRGETIGPGTNAFGSYLPRRRDGRFIVHNGYFEACWTQELYEVYTDMKPLVTNYIGFKVTGTGLPHYGWISAVSDDPTVYALHSYRVTIHPEPGVPIRAGLDPVPTPKVQYLAQSVEISWHPAWGDDWRLEASPSLATNATWSAVTSVVSNRVEMATLGSQRFFRLRKSEP